MSFILVSTPLDPQQGGFYHVGNKQTLRAGRNTSGPTVRDSFWVIQREWQHTACILPLIVIQIRGDKQHTDWGGLWGFWHRLPKHKHRQRNLQPNTQIFKEKASERKAEANQPNKHTPHIEGPKGIHYGPARLKTAAQWAEGAEQEKGRWGMNKSCL